MSGILGGRLVAYTHPSPAISHTVPVRTPPPRRSSNFRSPVVNRLHASADTIFCGGDRISREMALIMPSTSDEDSFVFFATSSCEDSNTLAACSYPAGRSGLLGFRVARGRSMAPTFAQDILFFVLKRTQSCNGEIHAAFRTCLWQCCIRERRACCVLVFVDPGKFGSPKASTF